MGWFKMAMQLLPFVLRLMGIAEKFVSKPGSGAEKKELVKAGTKAVVEAVGSVSTGGQKETWENIESVIDPAIDVASAFMFPKE